MTRLAALAVLAACTSAAHVMSMSTGVITIDGAAARYELRIPLYEIAHVQHPEDDLLAHVQFAGAHMESKACHADPPSESYVCNASYRFPAPVESLKVDCTLASITVPNHVHLLHAALGGKSQDAVFDSTLTSTTLRFREPAAAEAAVTEATGGLLRAVAGPVQLLFLAALVLASRSRRELIVLGGAFFLGQCLAVIAVPFTGWQPAPRFVEAAAALTVAYLAVEVLLLPKAGARSFVAAALGCFHGLWLLLFVQASHYHAAYVLAGAAIGEAAVLAALGWLASRISLGKAVPAAASALLIFGLAWFWMRLRG